LRRYTKEFAQHLFQTVYLGSENSSTETQSRSAALAAEIGSAHLDVKIDAVVAAVVMFFVSVTKRTPKFKVDGRGLHSSIFQLNVGTYFCGDTLGTVTGSVTITSQAEVRCGREEDPG
jgi:hypothetical protein